MTTAQDVLETASQGVIGIDDHLDVFEGYDDVLESASLGALPEAERIALADAMIARWQRYKEAQSS